jgi:hypothetical protein
MFSKAWRSRRTKENENSVSTIMLAVLSLLVLGVIVTFSVVVPVLHNNQMAAIESSRSRLLTLENDVMEQMMGSSAANTTIIQNGTFLWGMSNGGSAPAQACTGVFYPSVIAVNTPGANYVVGEIIVFRPLTAGTPVLRVSAVGVGGGITTIDVLTPGCCDGSTIMSTAATDGAGTGATFSTICDLPNSPPTEALFGYPIPPDRPIAAPRQGTFSVMRVTVGSLVFTVLELTKPDDSRTPFKAVMDTDIALDLQLTMYNFDPVPPELIQLTANFASYPLTLRNRAVLSMTDNTNCVATQVCTQAGFLGSSGSQRSNAIAFGQTVIGTENSGGFYRIYPYITFGYSDYVNLVKTDFIQEEAVFTLNEPLHLMLPTV